MELMLLTTVTIVTSGFQCMSIVVNVCMYCVHLLSSEKLSSSSPQSKLFTELLAKLRNPGAQFINQDNKFRHGTRSRGLEFTFFVGLFLLNLCFTRLVRFRK